MNEELQINHMESYELAEQKAAHYFNSLSAQVLQKSFIPTLTKDFNSWKQHHIHHHSFLSIFSRKKKKPDTKGYYSYIQWLDYTGKLEPYLDRSISYIFMRDLGKDLNSQDTQFRVQRVVENLKNQLTQSTKGKNEQRDSFNMTRLYRKAQEEGIESTYIWLMEKLKVVTSHIPEKMDAEQAQRKLIKIIAGVLMHVIEEMREEVSPEERKVRLEEAIRLGYSYGLTYPFIDDLFDAKVLSDQEEKQYSDLIRTTLTTGKVPNLGEWTGENKDLIQFIHSELRDAFQYIKAHQRKGTISSFFEQAYVFFESQEVDRKKELTNSQYSNEELYIPVILKSASSRLIIRSVISAPEDEGFESRTFYYGIYNQLADDFADMFHDMKDGAVTPYTYYLKYHDQRQDLINPFEMYWSVISHLIHNVYNSDRKTCEVILNRAINGLKRFKERLGAQKYKEIMELLTSDMPTFNGVIQQMVRKADDVDFFDKLLRDHMITMLKNEKKEQEDFLDQVENIRNQINANLHIPKKESNPLLHEPIVNAANYSLEGDGKRLRPVMAWVMGVNYYGLSQQSIIPLVKSLEYMHTASLILDDLPSQDNASTRRGRQTLHKVYNPAVAELTSLYLTQKAIEEQTFLHQFDAATLLKTIQYSAQATEEMCKGQAMDLISKGKNLTLEQLNTMCFYKTGIAFEASLIMPAMLAGIEDSEIQALKKFARHAGVAFQIKDDLLDVEGNVNLLGKPIGQDIENESSTFVTVLGVEEAKKAMWEHYCLALEALQDIPRQIPFLKHLMNYIVNRDH